MNTFILTADTANGVEKHDLTDFFEINPGHEFVRAQEFSEYLDGLEDGVIVAAIFDPLAHAAELAEIESGYGIK